MSLFENSMMYGADTVNIQAGGRSFTQALAEDGPGMVAGAVLSGAASIYNTGAAAINAFGGDVESWNVVNTLEGMDAEWAQAYKDNQTVSDIGGFIATSLIPGGIFVKGLNAARAGNASGQFARTLNFARTKQAEALQRALGEMAVEGGTVFSRINKNKLAAMGWGYADQTLTAAAFEAGVAVTMKESPLLADDSWWDIGKTAMVGALFGGVIGGSIDSLILQSEFKTAVKSLDLRQRKYDLMSGYQDLNLTAGDQAYGIAKSLLALPKEVATEDKILSLSFSIARKEGAGKGLYNPETGKFEVDVTQALTKALNNTQRTAMLDFESALRGLAGDADDVALPVAKMILRDFDKLKAANAPPSAMLERFGDYLYNLVKVEAASAAKFTPDAEDLYYFRRTLPPSEVAKLASTEDWKNAIVRNTPWEDNRYSKPHIYTGSKEQMAQEFADAALIGEGPGRFATQKDAWAAGRTIALLPDNTLAINPKASYWKQLKDPVYNNKRWLNTRTGTLTDDTVLTAADALPVGKLMKPGITSDAVHLPEISGVSTRKISMETFNHAGDVTYFTARHAWASQLSAQQLPHTVDRFDFSMLDRIRSLGLTPEQLDAISIVDKSGYLIGSAADVSLESFIASSKNNFLMETLFAAGKDSKSLDLRELGYRLNLDPKAIETLVGREFRWDETTKELITKSTRELDEYLFRENVIAEFKTPYQFKGVDGGDGGSGGKKLTWREKRNLIMEGAAETGGTFVTGELAWAYNVQQAIRATKNASAAVLGSEKASMLPDLAQDAAKLADSNSVGSTAFGFSNADYGDTLRLALQTSGKLTHKWVGEAVEDVTNALTAASTKLLSNPEASAELGTVWNILRSHSNKFVQNPLDPMELIDKRLLAPIGKQGEKVSPASVAKFMEMKAALEEEGVRTSIKFTQQDAKDLFNVHQGLNAERLGKNTVLWNARGVTSNRDPMDAYAPPIDTGYFTHFVFVRPKNGKMFGTSETAMVFGRNADELASRVAKVDANQFDVITKDQTEAWFKAKDLYEFDRTINTPRINSELQRSGALAEITPEMRGTNLVEDLIRWHSRQATKLVRDAVETNYAQQFEELKKLGDQYTGLATSQMAGTTKLAKSSVANPFDDYRKLALDISKRSEYTFLSQANEFVDALGTRAYQAIRSVFGDAQKGLVTWEQANKVMENHGVRGHFFADQEGLFLQNAPRDRNLIKEYVAKANMLLANTVLRLDFANSLMNVVSTPLLLSAELASIKTLAATNPQAAGKLAELMTVTVPGTNKAIGVPTTGKLLANATANFFGDTGEALIARYKMNGDIKDTLSQYRSMLDSLALRADFQVFSKNVDAAFEKMAKFTLNEQAEQFSRFIAADTMRQVTDPLVEAGIMAVKEQNAYISTFTNRVQGNYISSQRPVVFQGVLGSAVSLFQTYSFNLMQQLTRHIGNKDKRAIATMYGMQSGLFGLNGTPFFDAVNTHLIGNAAINDGHFDAYSVAPQLLGKEVGDWLMYGTVSAFPAWGDKAPALYTRGDINPRHASILPLHPLDIPAIDASIRVVSNLFDVSKKLANGGAVGTTLLQGLEHNGLNRPLAGFAQALAMQSTTGKGGLISATSDFDLITNASRIMGAKPMDEAIALNTMYRNKAYQVADSARREALGEAVKTHLYANRMPPLEDLERFQKDYAAAGGRIENFNASLQKWMKDANRSVIEQMRAHMGTSYSQRLNEVMGGLPLQDYRNSSSPQEE